jgi:hypothetical protein
MVLPPIVTDETRAGERGVSPFELRVRLSGEGTCDLGHIPRVVLWRSGSALSFFDRACGLLRDNGLCFSSSPTTGGLFDLRSGDPMIHVGMATPTTLAALGFLL